MKKHITILFFALVLVDTQSYSQTKVKFGGNIGYHIGSGGQQDNISPFLFFKSGQSAGLDFTLIPKKGTTRLKLAADYIIGTNDETALKTYAKGNNIDYTSYKFNKTNPSGFSIMASPQFMLFPKSKNKKLPLMWLDLKVGALFSNQQNVQFYQGQTAPSKEIKSNTMSFVYNPSLIVNVIKTKKLFINLKAGYSNFGGFGIGVGITEQDCHQVPCFRCYGSGCITPTTTDTPKK
jgi:hypothetical protein